MELRQQKLWQELLKQAAEAVKKSEGHVQFGRRMEKAGFFLAYAKPTGCAGISDQEFVSSIINYLNAKAGTRFRSRIPSKIATQILIWRKDGYGVDDFKRIVDKKWLQWQGSKYQEAMTPETLFGKTHFENYVGQIISHAHRQPSATGSSDRLDEAAAGAKRPVQQNSANTD